MVLGVTISAFLPDYRLRLLATAAMFGLLASAIDVPMGVCGVPIFGASLPFAIGAYAFASVARDGNRMLLAFVAGGIIAGATMAALSWVCFSLRLSPLQFGLVTLLLTLSVEQFVSSSPRLLGGSNGIAGISAGMVSDRIVIIVTLFAAVLLFSILLWVRQSQFGVLMRAVRDDARRSAALGYDTRGVRVLAVAVGAVAASIAGALFAPITGIVVPSLFGLSASLVVSVWIALGRPGSSWGPAVVAVCYKLLQSELGSVLENIYLLVFGILIFGGARWLLHVGALKKPEDLLLR